MAVNTLPTTTILRPCEVSAIDRDRPPYRVTDDLTLRDLRENMSLTQTELARRVGVSQATVSYIERMPLVMLRTHTARKYLAALGLGVDIFVIPASEIDPKSMPQQG